MRRDGAVGALAVLWMGLGLTGGLTPAYAQDTPWPTEGWERTTAVDAGLDPAPLRKVVDDARAGRYGNVDHLLLIRRGRLALDEAFDLDYREITRGYTGALGCGWDACDDSWLHDFNYYHPDYHPFYQGRRVHSLQSVTKSVSATVLGMILGDRGTIDFDRPIRPYFDAYDLSAADPAFGAITLHDLLTMRSGIEWHETDRPLDASNTTIQLERSDDWIRFTLDQPMDARPGERWVYNSGGSQLMAGIGHASAGRHLHEYAEERLFRPLGIGDVHWKRTPRGFPDALGGLYLEAADLAKIGYLYLMDGTWDGARILPEGWVRRATARHVEGVNAAGWGYGYQWWRPDRSGVEIWAGLGFGGQALLVMPELDIVAVVNAWNVFGGGGSVTMPFVDAIIAAARQR